MELHGIARVDAVTFTLPGICGNDAVILTSNGHDGAGNEQRTKKKLKEKYQKRKRRQKKEILPSVHGVRVEAMLHGPGARLAAMEVQVVCDLHLFKKKKRKKKKEKRKKKKNKEKGKRKDEVF